MQYLVDASEVELWCSDKLREKFHQDLGKDEMATSKLLTKSKVISQANLWLSVICMLKLL